MLDNTQLNKYKQQLVAELQFLETIEFMTELSSTCSLLPRSTD